MSYHYHTIVLPLSYHCLTIIIPLSHNYHTIVLPLSYHYFTIIYNHTIILPLPCDYLTIILLLSYHYNTIIISLSYHYHTIKSWRQHPTRHQLYGRLPHITKTIQVRRTRHAGHCWRSRDELISDVLLWTPTYGPAKAGRSARTYIQQLCEDTVCSPEDLPEAMNDREKWRETIRDIRVGGTTWWWWWSYKVKAHVPDRLVIIIVNKCNEPISNPDFGFFVF